jgi:rubrerythrin
MDPNATIRELRIELDSDSPDWSRILDLLSGLEEWLSRGGSEPESPDWRELLERARRVWAPYRIGGYGLLRHQYGERVARAAALVFSGRFSVPSLARALDSLDTNYSHSDSRYRAVFLEWVEQELPGELLFFGAESFKLRLEDPETGEELREGAWIEYLNTGDSYKLSIIWLGSECRVSSWADYLEEWEREQERELEQERADRLPEELSNLRESLRAGDLSGDPLSTVLGALFDCAEELSKRGDGPPDSWQFREGAGGSRSPNEPFWEYGFYSGEEPSSESLELFGEILRRYRNKLDIAEEIQEESSLLVCRSCGFPLGSNPKNCGECSHESGEESR